MSRTYDPERDYARMKAAGVFRSLGRIVYVSIELVVAMVLYFFAEGRERPEWLNDYESELDAAIASLRSSSDSK